MLFYLPPATKLNYLVENKRITALQIPVADTLQIKYLQHSGKKKYCTPSIKVYFPIIEALVLSILTSRFQAGNCRFPYGEIVVSLRGNESFQPEILAFPARDCTVLDLVDNFACYT